MSIQNITIVDRVVERLKAQPIGDLITEEDLHDIVKEAIPKVFFSEKVVCTDYGRTETIEPLVYKALKENMTTFVEAAVSKWVVDNSDKVIECWTKVFEEGIEQYVMRLTADRSARHIEKMLSAWITDMNSQRGSQGLPYLPPLVMNR